MRKVLALLVHGVLVSTLLFAQTSERLKLVERYERDLKSRDAAKRADAARGLGDLEMTEAIDALVVALSDTNAVVRQAAASGLWNSSGVAKRAVAPLRRALGDSDPAVVVRAAGALIAMDEDPSSMADPLRGVLQRGNEVDRFLAARALIGIEAADRLAPPILDYLRRNVPDPKAPGDWSARRDNFEAGTKALRRLSATNDRASIPLLSARLQDHPLIIESVLLALGDFTPRPDRWVETLLASLTSPAPDVRQTAAALLGKQTVEADVKLWAIPVSRLVSDPDKGVRDDAIRALKGARGLAIGAMGALTQAVRTEPDGDVRALAAEAIGEIADASFATDAAVKTAAARDALPALVSVLDRDPNREVRAKALRSIDKLQIDTTAAAEILARAAVQQTDRNLRLDALQLLRNRGKEAAPARAAITPLKNDNDELIRRLTDAALEAMTSSSYGSRTVSTVAVDPGARDKALAFLRERKHTFTEEAYYSALDEVELDVVEAFLDAGMSPNQKFSRAYGNPALRVLLEADEACGAKARPTPSDAKAILRLLLARGGNPNISDDRGNTPLMEAVAACDVEVTRILLGAKADMNAKNITGLTAFEFGLFDSTDGAAALAAAGFRLSAEKVKMYQEAYAKDSKRLELIRKATGK
ncbi:MAG TPA: HEAT repeat domain-containing protein [Vicinamibacterales bacterium]|nr:HEAT repeat domain-containing protein [Vicinamibacterales bacterium]